PTSAASSTGCAPASSPRTPPPGPAQPRTRPPPTQPVQTEKPLAPQDEEQTTQPITPRGEEHRTLPPPHLQVQASAGAARRPPLARVRTPTQRHPLMRRPTTTKRWPSSHSTR